MDYKLKYLKYKKKYLALKNSKIGMGKYEDTPELDNLLKKLKKLEKDGGNENYGSNENYDLFGSNLMMNICLNHKSKTLEFNLLLNHFKNQAIKTKKEGYFPIILIENIMYYLHPKKRKEIQSIIPSGKCINGDCVNGVGEFKYETGSIYKGEWKNGMRHGLGELILFDKNIFNGNWENNFLIGKAKITFSNGNEELIYYSPYIPERGYLKKICKKGNCINGFGIATNKLGDKTKAKFKDGKLHGKAKIYNTINENTLVGQFRYGKSHGKISYYNHGIISYYNHGIIRRYICKFSYNVKNYHYYYIYGILVFPIINYIGTVTIEKSLQFFKNDFLPELKENGILYEGETKNYQNEIDDDILFPPKAYITLPGGKGKYTFKNGDVYEGELEYGLEDGIGKLTYKDGSVYEGEWKKGFENGNGKLTYKDGSFKEGKWEDGHFIG